MAKIKRPFYKMLVFTMAMLLAWLIESLTSVPTPVKNGAIALSIKAQTMKGFPVSGAEIRINKKLYGYTTAYGEWEGLIQITNIDAVSISLSKVRNQEVFTQHKDLQIPELISSRTSKPQTMKAHFLFPDFTQRKNISKK